MDSLRLRGGFQLLTREVTGTLEYDVTTGTISDGLGWEDGFSETSAWRIAETWTHVADNLQM